MGKTTVYVRTCDICGERSEVEKKPGSNSNAGYLRISWQEIMFDAAGDYVRHRTVSKLACLPCARRFNYVMHNIAGHIENAKEHEEQDQQVTTDELSTGAKEEQSE